MKMTIVTDRHGKLVGAVHSHTFTEKRDGMEATVKGVNWPHRVGDAVRTIPTSRRNSTTFMAMVYRRSGARMPGICDQHQDEEGAALGSPHTFGCN